MTLFFPSQSLWRWAVWACGEVSLEWLHLWLELLGCSGFCRMKLLWPSQKIKKKHFLPLFTLSSRPSVRNDGEWTANALRANTTLEITEFKVPVRLISDIQSSSTTAKVKTNFITAINQKTLTGKQAETLKCQYMCINESNESKSQSVVT